MADVLDGQDTIARVNRCFGLHFKIVLFVSPKGRRFVCILDFVFNVVIVFEGQDDTIARVNRCFSLCVRFAPRASIYIYIRFRLCCVKLADVLEGHDTIARVN